MRTHRRRRHPLPDASPTAHGRRLLPCLLCLAGLAGQGAAVAQDLIAHPESGSQTVSLQDARQFMTMRRTTWPNGLPLRVFVLPDDHPLHRQFTKSLLGLFPYQLRRAWDRQLFSGTGQAPITVANELEMIQRVATTPGGLGYAASPPGDGSVHVLEIR